MVTPYVVVSHPAFHQQQISASVLLQALCTGGPFLIDDNGTLNSSMQQEMHVRLDASRLWRMLPHVSRVTLPDHFPSFSALHDHNINPPPIACSGLSRTLAMPCPVPAHSLSLLTQAVDTLFPLPVGIKATFMAAPMLSAVAEEASVIEEQVWPASPLLPLILLMSHCTLGFPSQPQTSHPPPLPFPCMRSARRCSATHLPRSSSRPWLTLTS
jgi:hypothetical protein